MRLLSLIFIAFLANPLTSPLGNAFEIAGFTCNEPNTTQGTYCSGNISIYPLPIGILIPPGYIPTEKAEITLFLHGHNYGPVSTLDQILTRFSVLEHVAGTKRNRITIFPHSLNKCDEFKSDLAPSHKMKPFMETMIGLLQKAELIGTTEIGSIALVGQSGAYAPLAMIIDQDLYREEIGELYLLDSMYGNVPSFTRFALNPKNRFWSCYLPKSSTRTQNELVMSHLDQAGVSYFKKAGDITLENAESSRLGFIEANTTHGGAIKYLNAFMGSQKD
jgi:hypothetical protein